MTLTFRNLTTLSDDDFYTSRARSCLEASTALYCREPFNDNTAMLALWYRHRAEQYLADLVTIRREPYRFEALPADPTAVILKAR